MLVIAALLVAGLADAGRVPRLPLNGDLLCPPGYGCPPGFCCNSGGACTLECAPGQFVFPRLSDVEGELVLDAKPDPHVANVVSRSTGGVLLAYWSMAFLAVTPPEDIPADLLTHIVYTFARVDANFQIFPDSAVDVNVANPEQGMYRRIITSAKRKNPDVKVLLSIGGPAQNAAGSPTQNVLSTMVSTRENRATFIANLMAWVRLHAFDGFDIDWEFPGDPKLGGLPDDKANFVMLLAEIHEALDADERAGNPRMLCTLALIPSPSLIAYGYDLARLHNHVDWINIMLYELHYSISTTTAPHSALYNNRIAGDIQESLFQFDMVPADKIVAGLGLFAKAFKLAPGSTCAYGQAALGFTEELLYSEVVDALATDANLVEYHDANTATSYFCRGGVLYTYDSADDVAAQVHWLRGHGLKGIFIWTVNCDTKGTYPLTNIIRRGLSI
ncbi:GH18 domain-containing protein [Plasmodiophora brassicae]|nr:GH18 chitinase [Plasmodiophora brassicae]